MEYTGIENVYLNGMMMGFEKEEMDERLDEILKFADIGEFVNQPCKTYSSGMFVRLAFAVAINIDPEILIVDEALSVGDVFFQAKCYKKFEDFKVQGKTIIFVSHDISSVAKYCDRVILLNKGVKLSEGNPKETIDLYKKVLLNQSQNIASGQVLSFENKGAGTDLWKSNYVLNPQVNEYGTGEAEIIDFAVIDEYGSYTNCIQKGTSFTIKSKVRFQTDIQDPIFTYTFKTVQGTAVTGTMYEKVGVGLARAGETYVATFKQNMDLQGGEYLLSISCTGYVGGEFRAYHRLYDVVGVTVISDKNTVGFYDMNSETQFLKELYEIVKQNNSGDYADVIQKKASYPWLYHLSGIRQNLIDWLPITKEMRVLERNAECGALTGRLLEMAGEVCSVTEDEARAAIIRARCDSGLHVYSEMEQIRGCFDVILIVGKVWRFREELGKLRELLTENGRLILADANRLGLKYFAGCQEEYRGGYFTGISGYDTTDVTSGDDGSGIWGIDILLSLSRPQISVGDLFGRVASAQRGTHAEPK